MGTDKNNVITIPIDPKKFFQDVCLALKNIADIRQVSRIRGEQLMTNLIVYLIRYNLVKRIIFEENKIRFLFKHHQTNDTKNDTKVEIIPFTKNKKRIVDSFKIEDKNPLLSTLEKIGNVIDAMAFIHFNINFYEFEIEGIGKKGSIPLSVINTTND